MYFDFCSCVGQQTGHKEPRLRGKARFLFEAGQSDKTASPVPPVATRFRQGREGGNFSSELFSINFRPSLIGVTIPTVLYLIWGVMEVASVPLAK